MGPNEATLDDRIENLRRTIDRMKPRDPERPERDFRMVLGYMEPVTERARLIEIRAALVRRRWRERHHP